MKYKKNTLKRSESVEMKAISHDQLKQMLKGREGQAFVVDLTRSIYNWAEQIPPQYIQFCSFDEVSIRYSTDEKTRLGLEKEKYCRLDSVLFVKPGWRSLSQGCCYTVGIELKGNLQDLKKDKKFEKYLGWTDFFFFAVPDFLLDAALEKTKDSSHVGVINIEYGLIVKLPKRIKVPTDNSLQLHQQVLYGSVFNQHTPASEETTHEHSGDSKPCKKPKKTSRAETAVKVTELNQEVPESVRLKLCVLPDKVQLVYHTIRLNPRINAVKIEKKLSFGETVARRLTATLVRKGLIERQGSKKTGGYVVKTPPDPK